jgi:hypothetical protein
MSKGSDQAPSTARGPYFVTVLHPGPNPTPTHNVKSLPYPYMKVMTTYNDVASLKSLQWLLLCPWVSQQLVHCNNDQLCD